MIRQSVTAPHAFPNSSTSLKQHIWIPELSALHVIIIQRASAVRCYYSSVNKSVRIALHNGNPMNTYDISNCRVEWNYLHRVRANAHIESAIILVFYFLNIHQWHSNILPLISFVSISLLPVKGNENDSILCSLKCEGKDELHSQWRHFCLDALVEMNIDIRWVWLGMHSMKLHVGYYWYFYLGSPGVCSLIRQKIHFEFSCSSKYHFNKYNIIPFYF